MALQKFKEDRFGNGGINYWKIIETNINWLNKNSHICLAGYNSKISRENLKQPMDSVFFDWNNDDFPFDINILNQENENIIHIAYEKIKESKLDENNNETNFFADAMDV